MALDTATLLLQRHSELLSDRAASEDRWRKIVRYVLPQESAGWGVNPDGPPKSPTVDDTGRECLDNLTAGLDEMLFRRAPYEVVPIDGAVAEQGGYAVDWAEYATHNLTAAMEHPRSGFRVARQTLLRSVAGLGHGVCFITERPGSHLVFRQEPVSEVCIAENADGQVDTRFRQYEMTVRQVIERWGNKASPHVQHRVERSPGEKVRILHAVFPRHEVAPSAHRTKMPWASVYVELDPSNILDEGGFAEFPFVVPRWDKRDCGPYGWCPSMAVLDEIMRVNAMGRTNLQSAHRIADPEVYLPNGMFRSDLVRRPGAVHYYDATILGGRAEVRQWPTSPQLPVAIEMTQAVQASIREAFFYYLLQPAQSPNMTATEWIGRQRQMARRMGAPVGRLEQEAADPLGKRAFALLVRAGVIQPPQPPWRLSDFEVRFNSPLSQLKQLADAEAIQRTLEGAASCAQFDPGVVRVIDAEETLRAQREVFGAPVKMLRDRQTVQQIRDADAQQQMAQAASQAAMTGATVAKLAGEARAAGQQGSAGV